MNLFCTITEVNILADDAPDPDIIKPIFFLGITDLRCPKTICEHTSCVVLDDLILDG